MQAGSERAVDGKPQLGVGEVQPPRCAGGPGLVDAFLGTEHHPVQWEVAPSAERRYVAALPSRGDRFPNPIRQRLCGFGVHSDRRPVLRSSHRRSPVTLAVGDAAHRANRPAGPAGSAGGEIDFGDAGRRQCLSSAPASGDELGHPAGHCAVNRVLLARPNRRGHVDHRLGHPCLRGQQLRQHAISPSRRSRRAGRTVAPAASGRGPGPLPRPTHRRAGRRRPGAPPRPSPHR